MVVQADDTFACRSAVATLERAICTFLADSDLEFPFSNLRQISAGVGVDQEIVRGVLKGMRLRGAVIFRTGLMTEDGDLFGSGYALAEDVRDMLRDADWLEVNQ